MVNDLIKPNNVKEIIQCVSCPAAWNFYTVCLQMNIIISEILLQNLAWNILGCQTFRRYHRNWQDSRDCYWFNNIFLYCSHNHLLYKLWLEMMLQLVIFLEPKCIYIFPSFDFHHFCKLLVDENKKKIHYKRFKHQKQNSLGLLQIPHMQINVALHSKGIQVGIAFSSLTSVIPKQFCFSSPFYQNHIWPFKFIHIDSVQMKSYNVFFWFPDICAILVELYQSWKACQLD